MTSTAASPDSTGPTPRITAVLPTYDRAQALRETLPGLLTLQSVDELIVVIDGSTDGTKQVLEAHDDGRLRIVEQPTNLGVTAARNRGAAEARGEWLVYLEDDCCFPHDFAEVLLQEARATGADVVGAPMVHPRPGQPITAAIEQERRRVRGDGGLDGVTRFPAQTMATPLLQAPVLVRRDVVRQLGFDEGFRGNAYREETDFFLRATAAGSRCVLTPRTCFWESGRYSGGAPGGGWRDEFWTARNNWRFLRRHRSWLRRHGYMRPLFVEMPAFLLRRARLKLRPS